MRKTLLLLASAALLLVGCAKEQVEPGVAGDGDMVEVDITAGTAVLTKAAIDKDGQADSVKRWIMEVRDGSGDVYSRKVDTEDAGTLQHTFNIKLFKNQQYTFAFWADNGGEFYDASDLSAVKYADGKAVVAGVDAKDAFSGVETLTFSQSISKTIVLHRPFAQLNVITKDLEDLRKDAISADAYNAFKPKNFKTTITVPTQFDVLTGTASQETELILAADDFYGKSPLSYEDAPKQATMFMAYIFATEGEKDIRTVNFKFDVDSQTGNNAFEFTDVPFQRNYRTNILGNFLSGDAEWTVQIDTVWSGEYDYPPFKAGSITEANASLEAGETNISISNPSDYASVDLTIPAVANGKDLIIEVADNAGMELKVDASNSTPKSISLAAVKAKSLNIDAPASHVELTAGEYTESVEASTSATTLVVGKNTTINTLKIKQGNAVIDGNVKTFVNETGAALVWNVASTAELANAVKFAGEGDEIKIAAGSYTMPALSKNNITISGVGGAVLECPKETVEITSDNVTLKDLTIKCNTQNIGDYGALKISKSAKLENVTFTEYSSKIVVVGGTGTVDFKGCRFENKGKGRAIMVWGGSPKINVDGCYFDNVYPFNVDGGSPVFTVKNSQLNGWTSYGGTTTATFEGCDFGKSTSGYAYCRPYRSTTFTKCNFCEGYLIDFGAAGVEIDLNECKLGGQPMTTAILEPDPQATEKCVLRIDGKPVYTDGIFMTISTPEQLLAFANYVNSGSAIVKGTFTLEADIDLKGIDWVSVGQTGHGQFGGTFDGQGHTISNLSINNTEATETVSTGLFGWLAYATVKNVNVNTAAVSGHHNVGVIAGYLEGSTIDNCTVTGATISCTHANDDADGDKCGGIVGFAGNAGTPVKNCTVNNTTINSGRDAGQVAGAAKEANLTGCSANSVTVTANGTSTGANVRNELIGRIIP